VEFRDLIQDSFDKNHSDIHFKHGIGIYFRKGGRLFRDVEVEVDPESIKDILLSVLSPKQAARLEEERRIDFGHNTLPHVRVRGNVFYQQEKLAGIFRLIPAKIPSCSELGLTDVVKNFAMRPRGLVLVAGPAGSGTTTTAAALVQEINRSVRKHIVCIEDPVEYVFKNDQSIITQREIGTSSVTFQHALKASLRQDPDVVFIGEMRDLDTFETAITMAETGHLVISTVHTIGACEVMDRIVNIFPPQIQGQIRTQLSLNIQGIVSQLLVTKGDTTDLTLAAEVFNPTFALRALIRKGEVVKIKNSMAQSVKDGCIPMEMSLTRLKAVGTITEATYDKAIKFIS